MPCEEELAVSRSLFPSLITVPTVLLLPLTDKPITSLPLALLLPSGICRLTTSNRVVTVPCSLPGVVTTSHFIIPGSADTAYGIDKLTGITNEANINTVMKTEEILKRKFFTEHP
jgi:hypothetical protein